MKQLIRLTETDLHKIVKETVNNILNEIGDTPEGQRKLGSLAARKKLRGNNPGDVHDYAKENGSRTSSYYKGYVEYMESNPDEMVKYAKDEFHKKKGG